MSRHPVSLLLISLLAVAALGACSRHPPAETAAAAATPTTPATPAPQAGQPGAAVNALLTDAQLKALQKSRAVESQVLQQQHDVDKKIDAESAGKD